ncbi:hypothetical protein [Vibrio pectenicida]|uniref:Uncharacterized protein n=1 Tax=Vibrio pectenicida TaxID=62763 RepID=A0A427TVV1_9VIBR|nr:hypothetical protein [Vibrio pectenicida]RSD28532.1 hypothetical protein EJA03_19175 [Vibrio pectenicida]
MKNKAIITFGVLLLTSATFVNASTFVYCGLPDGSDWDWLLGAHDSYETIEGQWARVTGANNQYFNVFRVNETEFLAKAFSCPAGYVPQPAESGTSRWEIFEIIRPDGSRYFIDGYKTYYSIINNQVTINHYFRSL